MGLRGRTAVTGFSPMRHQMTLLSTDPLLLIIYSLRQHLDYRDLPDVVPVQLRKVSYYIFYRIRKNSRVLLQSRNFTLSFLINIFIIRVCMTFRAINLYLISLLFIHILF